MTIAAQPTRVSYIGTGTQTDFTVTWRVLDASQLAVYVDEGLTSAYTVLGIGDPTCTVRFTTAPAAGTAIIVILDAPIVQERVFAPGPIRAVPVEDAADDDAIRDRTLAARLEQSIRVAPYEEGGSVWLLPSVAERAFRALAFDAAGRLALAEVEDIVAAADAITWDNGDGLDLDNEDDLTYDGSARTIEAQTVVYQPATVRRDVQTAIERIGLTPQDFGAIGDGVTDDTAAIQAALNAVRATGGEIMFPPGDYLHSGGIELGTVGVFNEGAIRLRSLAPAQEPRGPYGREGARLICSSPTAVHFKFNDLQRVIIQDLAFCVKDDLTATAGNCLWFNGGLRPAIIGCFFEKCYNTVLIDSSSKPLMKDCEIRGALGSYGLRVVGTAGRRIDQGHFANIFVKTATSYNPTTDGVQIGDNVHSIDWISVVTNLTRYGFVIGDDTTNLPAFHRFYSCDAESAVTGILIRNGTHLWFKNSYSSINLWMGAHITANFATYGGPVWFDGCRFSGNGRHGVLLEGCPGVHFLNCNIAENSNAILAGGGGGPANTYDGIQVATANAHFDVIGCRIGGNILEQRGATGQQRYGIGLTSACTDVAYRIIGNDMQGNSTGAIFDGGTASRARVRWANNDAADGITESINRLIFDTVADVPRIRAFDPFGDGNTTLVLNADGIDGVQIGNDEGLAMFVRATDPATVNYAAISGRASGSPPIYGVGGPATDIDVALAPKGAGSIRLVTPYTAGASAVIGSISIKDNSGTIRKLAVIA